MADCIWDEAHIRRLLPGMRSYQSTDFLIFSLWPAQRGRQWVKGSMVHPVFGRPHRAVRLSFFSVVMAKGQWHVFRCSEAVRWAPQSLNWMPRVDPWHNCVHCVQHFKVFVCSRSLSACASGTGQSDRRFSPGGRTTLQTPTIRLFDPSAWRIIAQSEQWLNTVALGGLGCGVNFQVFGSVAVPSYLTYTSAKCSAPALDAARAITTVFEKRCHN